MYYKIYDKLYKKYKCMDEKTRQKKRARCKAILATGPVVWLYLALSAGFLKWVCISADEIYLGLVLFFIISLVLIFIVLISWESLNISIIDNIEREQQKKSTRWHKYKKSYYL